MSSVLRSLRVGIFLTLRYIRRGSISASLLIVTIMFLTFLNVVVVRGVLVGLPVGASISYMHEYSGEVIITPLSDQKHIDRTQYVERLIEATEGYAHHSARYIASGAVRANYIRPQKETKLPDQVVATIAGIDPEEENNVTDLASLIVEGRYLLESDTNSIVLGSQLLERYAGDTPEAGGTPETSGTVSNVFPGDTVRLLIDDVWGEYVVVGVLKSKVGQNAKRIFMHESHLRKVLGRSIDKKDEIAVGLMPGFSGELYAQALLTSGIDEYATVQTARQSQGKFLDDIEDTFDLLGNGIGLVGIIVAAITVFIMIFIVALNRQKQIGILKGIGISHLAIESSYVFLSIIYAIVGISLGVLVLYLGIAPYIDAHPINFPFAEGILVAPWEDTLLRSVILIATTLLAGYLPARMIVEKHTINAILGR